ncbi:hypothetical protein BJP25_08855 [Actinokineospora bangkokensis]|uniref:S-adenosyl-L-methionine-dependent methyltransferase n=1 Tax=Actinokineospora bangkokensis TaxID=1193682 RepID=A0A1Q9LSV0_9PSEU|nr:hypothetical protein BJP25_08855 [Actinokineospora bangkokensis]
MTTGVGLTAVIVAAARAIAASRPGSLSRDDYAERFVRAVPTPVAVPTRFDQVVGGDRDPLWGRCYRFFDLRTRVFDDFVVDRVACGARQVVVLGAGLDSRAVRLDLPEDCAVYELDLPDVLEFKRRALAGMAASPAASLNFVGVDLRGAWAGPLRAAGFDPTRPSAWLAEGLFPYLSAAAERAILTAVDSLASPGSAFCFESIPGHRPHGEAGAAYVEIKNRLGLDIAALFNTEPRPSSLDVLAATGWRGSCVPSMEHGTRHGGGPGPEDGFVDFHWTTVDKT